MFVNYYRLYNVLDDVLLCKIYFNIMFGDLITLMVINLYLAY